MEGTGKKGISAAVLKNVALITMTIDHITAFLIKEALRGQHLTNLYDSPWYAAGRIIGRIAFVLYAFMIAEGAYHTRNKVKYAGRLLLLAIISVIPHSYVNAKKFFNPNDRNIFFLLFVGLLTIYAYDWLRDHLKVLPLSILARLAVIALACYIAIAFKFEYGMMGILLILAFYIFRYDTPKMAVAVVLVMSLGYMANTILRTGVTRWFAGHSANLLDSLLKIDKIQIFGLLALPFIFLYNGNKGKQLPKAFYYLFYPVHLGIIGLILYLK